MSIFVLQFCDVWDDTYSSDNVVYHDKNDMFD